MQIISSRQDLPKCPLGFVPTMGALHAGHVQLIEASLREHPHTIVSIFVNPTQFNSHNDFSLYPNSLDADIQLLKNLGVDTVFIPNENELYPDNKNFSIICNHPFANELEGRYRPKHFQGMLTIVLKLLNLIQPTTAYFGEKDYQQYWLVKKLTQAFFLNCKIALIPTMRDTTGLALSSRNSRLSPQGLNTAREVAQLFLTQPLKLLPIPHIHLDYLSLINHRWFLAYWLEGVRLIDTRSH